MQIKQYLNTLTIIHLALLMGQLMFAVVNYVLISSGSYVSEGEDLRGLFMFVVPLLAISGVIAAKFIPRMQLPAIQAKESLGAKLMDYRTLCIMKYAFMEGAALVALVAYLLTTEIFFMGVAGVMMVVFFLEKPSKHKIVMDLALSPDEKNILDNPEATIK